MQVSRTPQKAEEITRYMEALLNSDNIMMTVLDAKGRIVRLSRGCLNLLESEEEQLIGTDSRDSLGHSKLYECAITGQRFEQQVDYLNNHEMIVNCIPLKDNEGVFGAVGIVAYKDGAKIDDTIRRLQRAKSQLDMYKGKLEDMNTARYSLDNIIGDSMEMAELKKLIKIASGGHSNVLITGESGTGKELFAHAFHMESERRDGPFISINCAAIPGELLESELFGYEEGAFTGARKGGKLGVFQVADGGTLFLDEIGELPLGMQAKLLRVIQERAVQKVGSYIKESVDVRIVTATNRDLQAMQNEGMFRRDLYFRLDVIHIVVPPLRQRREDIPEISLFMIKKYEEILGVEITGISSAAMDCFIRYDWPGNVRELEHVIERAANFLDGEKVIHVRHLPKRITGKSQHLENMSLKEYMEATERKVITETLLECDGNKALVARQLKISRTSLYEKIDKYKISNGDYGKKIEK